MDGRTAILAVDHGERRIGVAIASTETAPARPLTILKHVSREKDARRVLQLADEYGAALIVVGQSTDEEGMPNVAGRRAVRFAEQLKLSGAPAVVLWDESMSTQDARQRRLETGVSQKRRRLHVDAEAAAVILQSYLDALPRPHGDHQH